MNEIRDYLHVMGENEVLQIDFAGKSNVSAREIVPAELKTALQQMQPGETVIVRFDHEES